MRIAVIGAGPSGLALARYMASDGYEVVVYEAQRELAVKPCGWGLPYTSDDHEIRDILKIALDNTLWEYEGYRVYIDGELLFENKKKRVLGYIIDKRGFLRNLGEGIDLRIESPARYLGEGRVLVKGKEVLKYDVVVNAGGFYAQKKSLEKIPAIQYILEGFFSEPEIPELYFNSSLVGYAWFFPESRRRARIGIGGYADVNTLENLLRSIILSKSEFRNSTVLKREGALVTVGGVDLDLLSDKDPYHVGEAVGAVMPATGEGIRPGIYSSLALYKSFKENRSYKEIFMRTRIYRAINLQRRILDLEIMLSPETRKRFLMKTPEDILIRLSLGDFSTTDLLRLSARPETIRVLLETMRSM